MKFSTVLSLTIAMLIAATSASAAKKSKFYKWTDENGVVHYTQDPPPGQVEANELTVQDLGPASSVETPVEEPATEPAQEPNSISEQLASDAEAYRKQAELLEQRQEQVRKLNCEKGRALVAGLEPSQRAVIRDADGSERVLFGDDRIRELEAARKLVRENCR